MPYDTLGDEELVTLMTLGEREALAELYARHARAVFGLILHMLKDTTRAEEVTQEVFLNLWQKAKMFRPERGKFLTWLLTSAHHRTIDELRRDGRFRSALEEVARMAQVGGSNEEDESPVDRAQRLEEAEVVRKALDVLPPEQQQVVMLAYYSGYSQLEIAEGLKQPLGTVKTRMRLAMQKLRASLALEREKH